MAGRTDKPRASAGSTLTVAAPDGLHVAFHRTGTGHPTLVFVHGLACDADYWRQQLSYFADRFSCVALDLAGHGRSGSDRDAWTIEAFGEDVAVVIEAIGKDVILVGHSLGGPVCLEAARRAGERVIGVIGVESFHWLGQDLLQPELEALVAAHGEDHRGAADASVRSWFPEDADPALVERVVRQALECPPDIYVAALRHLLEWFPSRSAEAIAVWPGRRVTINSTRFGADLLAKLSRAGLDVVEIEHSGHFPMLERPRELNHLLEQQIDPALGPDRYSGA